jgi:hypothetical protein
VVSVTPRPRFTPGERTPGNHWTWGWVGPRSAETRIKILCLCRGSNPDRPARIFWSTNTNYLKAVSLLSWTLESTTVSVMCTFTPDVGRRVMLLPLGFKPVSCLKQTSFNAPWTFQWPSHCHSVSRSRVQMPTAWNLVTQRCLGSGGPSHFVREAVVTQCSNFSNAAVRLKSVDSLAQEREK